MSITERETDLIISSISEVKELLRDSIIQLRQEIRNNKKQAELINTLLEVHDGRIDDVELKYMQTIEWIKNEEKQQLEHRLILERTAKRNSWFYPLITASILSIIAIILAILNRVVP